MGNIKRTYLSRRNIFSVFPSRVYKSPSDGRNYVADADTSSTTNVYHRDTDGDHFPDGSFYGDNGTLYLGEDRNNDGYTDTDETNPSDPDDFPSEGFVDEDGDGLPDLVEEELGTIIGDKDSDDDGISDGDEYFGEGLLADASEYWGFTIKTDPTNPDTDYDGLPDGLEMGVTPPIPDAGDIKGTYSSLGNTSQSPGMIIPDFVFGGQNLIVRRV